MSDMSLVMAFLQIASKSGTGPAIDALTEATEGIEQDRAAEATARRGDDRVTARIPDQRTTRECLTAWGTSYEQRAPLSRMMAAPMDMLEAVLPEGWTHVTEGLHHWIVDTNDGERLHWYMHPYDRIRVGDRS